MFSNALRASSPTGVSELDSDDDSLADIPTLIDDDSDSDDELAQPPDTVISRLAPAPLSYLPSSANIFPDVSSRAQLTPHAAVIADEEGPPAYVPPDYDSDDEEEEDVDDEEGGEMGTTGLVFGNDESEDENDN